MKTSRKSLRNGFMQLVDLRLNTTEQLKCQLIYKFMNDNLKLIML